MISNYIKSLIDVHSRVIVPDLGAFMLKGDSSKTIYFNEFLRFNDGLLVDYIAEQEQIDKIEAAKKVKAFVDNANKQLSSNKSVVLEGLGTLYLDVNEKIQMKTSESNSTQTSKPVEPEVDTTPREILFELEKTESVPVQTKTAEPEPVAIPKPQVTPSKPKTEPVAQAPVKEVKPAATQPKPKEAPAAVVKEKKLQSPPPPKKDAAGIDVIPTTTRRMVIVGVLGVMVIGAIVYFAFLRSSGKDSNQNQNITIGADSTLSKEDSSTRAKSVANSPKTKTPNKTSDVKHKEPTKSEPKVKVTADNKSKVTPVNSKVETPNNTIKTTTGKKFYVVAGTFSVESNADNLIKKLKEQGYQPDKIRNDVKNVFYVSFSSFADKTSASQEIKKLKAAGTEAWIYSR